MIGARPLYWEMFIPEIIFVKIAPSPQPALRSNEKDRCLPQPGFNAFV